jgi:CRP-like cAMP-binding protein
MLEYLNNNPHIKDFVEITTIFRHLSPEELAYIPFEQGSRLFKKGEIIYEEKDRINGFYCVQKGIIKIYKTGFDGREQIIRFAKKGDIMGFRSTITEERACTTTKVIEESEIYVIPGELVKELVKSNGAFAYELLVLTCKELGEANDYITDIAQKTVRERLAEVLIHLEKEFKLDTDKFLQINLTREELAGIVGTATETVIRLLSEFKQDGWVELHGRRIKLMDLNTLHRIANIP